MQGTVRPDLTVILDLDPEIGLKRARERGELDRFENEAQTFFNKVRSAYLEIAQNDPQRCVLIDAGQSLEQVQAELRARLIARFDAMGA